MGRGDAMGGCSGSLGAKGQGTVRWEDPIALSRKAEICSLAKVSPPAALGCMVACDVLWHPCEERLSRGCFPGEWLSLLQPALARTSQDKPP